MLTYFNKLNPITITFIVFVLLILFNNSKINELFDQPVQKIDNNPNVKPDVKKEKHDDKHDDKQEKQEKHDDKHDEKQEKPVDVVKKDFQNQVEKQMKNIMNKSDDKDIKSMDIKELKDLIKNIFDEKLKKVITKDQNNDFGLNDTNDIIEETIKENKAFTCNCEDIANKAIAKFLKNRRLIDHRGMLHYADQVFGDMGYSQLRLDNYIPLGSSGNGVYDSWDLANYSMINTDRWKPSEKNSIKCRNDVIYNPQPVESHAPVNLMNWNYSTGVMGPDNINVKYIEEKLNKTKTPQLVPQNKSNTDV